MNIIKSELFLSGFLRGGVEGPLDSAMMSRNKKRDSKQELQPIALNLSGSEWLTENYAVYISTLCGIAYYSVVHV